MKIAQQWHPDWQPNGQGGRGHIAPTSIEAEEEER